MRKKVHQKKWSINSVAESEIKPAKVIDGGFGWVVMVASFVHFGLSGSLRSNFNPDSMQIVDSPRSRECPAEVEAHDGHPVEHGDAEVVDRVAQKLGDHP